MQADLQALDRGSSVPGSYRFLQEGAGGEGFLHHSVEAAVITLVIHSMNM